MSSKMAASMPSSGAPLSQKQRKASLKRERRKRKRQALAKLREAGIDQQEHEEDNASNEEDEEEGEAVGERQRLHQEWLEREKVCQEEFGLKREKEEAARRKKEEEENRIREEWEAQQRREQEEREQKQQAKRDREEAVQKMLDQAESQLENGGPWKNPEAPGDYGTEKDRANCPFFLKTGSCRFGDRCSRKHVHPSSSSTLMVRGMFMNFGMEQSRRDDYDTDASLEYSEEEVQQQFLDFYEDVLPEFKSAGKVLQFKVSCNFEPHLRGNVYIQYDTEEQCKEAFVMFNGRWYAGRQLQCEFSPVTRWKTAICGLFDRQRCPKGKHCNFLHVFRNPTSEFWEADRDLHMSPDRGRGFTGRHSDRSERSWSQAWSQRSERPDRSLRRQGWGRSRSRERRSRSRERRSRSRERWSRSRSRESRRSQQSRRSGRPSVQSERSRRSRSRSRERRRSRSRDKVKARSPTDSREERSSRRSRSVTPRDERVSRDSAREKSKRSDRSSPKNSGTKDKTSEGVATPRHHKHLKKSKKKKSKKKRKHKKSKSPSGSSSADSGKESGGEGDTSQPSTPQGDVNTATLEEEVTTTDRHKHRPLEEQVATRDFHTPLPQEGAQDQPSAPVPHEEESHETPPNTA